MQNIPISVYCLIIIQAKWKLSFFIAIFVISATFTNTHMSLLVFSAKLYLHLKHWMKLVRPWIVSSHPSSSTIHYYQSFALTFIVAEKRGCCGWRGGRRRVISSIHPSCLYLTIDISRTLEFSCLLYDAWLPSVCNGDHLHQGFQKWPLYMLEHLPRRPFPEMKTLKVWS